MALIAGVQYGTPITSITYTGIPAGTILPCGKNTALTRTLLCDGTSYLTASYPELFAAIGYSFGGSGANFNVPDFRGRFLRGVDDTAGRDPNKLTRTAMNVGGNTGNNVGSVQSHDFASHNHIATANVTSMLTPGGSAKPDAQQWSSGGGWNTSSSGGLETRPINAYVNYCIAY